MTRDLRDRRGRVLSRDERKELRARAKAIRKTTKREYTTAEKLQIAFVVLIIAAIVFLAYRLAS